MSTKRVMWCGLGLGMLLLALLVLGVGARPAAAAGGGVARWAQLAPGDPGTDDIAGPDDHVVVSFTTPGSVAPNCIDGQAIHYGVGDAVLHWPSRHCWLPWINAVGSGLPASADINALHDECGPDEARCDTYLSFTKAVRVPGVGKVQPQDVVGAQWDENSQDLYHNFWLAFDGSDVGLTEASERIDALYIFDPADTPSAYQDCVILGWASTTGNYRVRDEWGGWLSGGGEDVLGFCASSIGPDTSGYWFLYHDGSAEGAPRNSLVGLAHEEGRAAYGRFNFLTKGPFWADEANGGAGDVFEYSDYNGGIYRGPLLNFWQATGATGIPDSIHIYYYDK